MSKGFIYIPPNTPSRCKWHIGADPASSPHTKELPKSKPKILPDIVYAMGSTPMVQINKLAKEHGIQCDLWAKVEFFNPGGSVKDRIVPRMVTDAEKAGHIKPGCTLIAPTSGNTGIGVAMYAAAKGYRAIIVMPQKMSKEKAETMRALGAEIYRTPNSASVDSMESSFAIAQKLQSEIPNSYVLDQYRDASNPLAHYDILAEEILEQCDGKLDMMVIGTGTGGTLTGLGRKLKEKCPECIIVGVDPVGSIMAHPDDLSTKAFFEVEGIGHDFVPTVCDSSVVDRWCKVSDKDSMLMARRLIKDEGILCGGSSGTAMAAALELAKDLKPGQKCVVLLPDGLRNYMTKFLSDEWMMEKGYLPESPELFNQWWSGLPVSTLKLESPKFVEITSSCQVVIQELNAGRLEEITVVDNAKSIKGVVTLTSLMDNLISGKVEPGTPVADLVQINFTKIRETDPLSKLARVLRREHFAVVVTGSEEKLSGIPTRIDLLNFVTSGKNSATNGHA